MGFLGHWINKIKFPKKIDTNRLFKLLFKSFIILLTGVSWADFLPFCAGGSPFRAWASNWLKACLLQLEICGTCPCISFFGNFSKINRDELSEPTTTTANLFNEKKLFNDLIISTNKCSLYFFLYDFHKKGHSKNL